MSVKRGTDGLIQVAPDPTSPVFVTVASMQSWTWDETNENIDVTVLGAQRARAQLTTFMGFNAGSEGFWDDDDLASGLGQEVVEAASLSGDSIMVRIYPNASGAGGTPATGDIYYEGECYVTGDNIGGAYDSAITSSLSFVGTGLPVHDVEA